MLIKKENIISSIHIEDSEYSTLIYEVTIFNQAKDFYSIKDSKEQFDEVSKMPSYIQEDWINSKKIPLNISTLNKQIKIQCDVLEIMNYGTKEYYILEKEIKRLIDIRTYLINNEYI
jgi:hypothetical protein